VALVIESLFGASVSLDGTPTATRGGEDAGAAPVSALDPAAALRGLRAGDRLVDVHADGRVLPTD
jgi:hypothetical protein